MPLVEGLRKIFRAGQPEVDPTAEARAKLTPLILDLERDTLSRDLAGSHGEIPQEMIEGMEIDERMAREVNI